MLEKRTHTVDICARVPVSAGAHHANARACARVRNKFVRVKEATRMLALSNLLQRELNACCRGS